MSNWYFYRKGYVIHRIERKIKWWEYILYFWVIERLVFYKRYFVELINEKGEVKRIYEK